MKIFGQFIVSYHFTCQLVFPKKSPGINPAKTYKSFTVEK